MLAAFDVDATSMGEDGQPKVMDKAAAKSAVEGLMKHLYDNGRAVFDETSAKILAEKLKEDDRRAASGKPKR